MPEIWKTSLDSAIDRLIGQLSSVTTESIFVQASVAFAQQYLLRQEIKGMMSPDAQVFYLIGLAMTTPMKGQIHAASEDQWMELIQLSETIFQAYVAMYKEGALADPESGIDASTEVAVFTFIRYLTTLPYLATNQSLLDLATFVEPFSEPLSQIIDMNVSEVRKCLLWFHTHVQEKFAAFSELAAAASENQPARFFQVARRLKVVSPAMHVAINMNFEKATNAVLLRAFQTLSRYPTKQFLKDVSPAIGHRFLKVFGCRRPSGIPYRYPNERNPYEIKPVALLNRETMYVLFPPYFYSSVARQLDVLLSGPQVGEKYRRRRDLTLERRVSACLRGTLKRGWHFYDNICENADGTNEHDLLVTRDGVYVIVETKAKRYREPFRDPKRSYLRLLGDFRSDSGIQKAYDQGNSLRQLLLQATEPVPLFNTRGTLIYDVVPPVRRVYLMVVTLERLGPPQTDLSFLLQKSQGDEYPWAVSIHDLETFMQALAWESSGDEILLDFLEKRMRLHGRIICSDELDLAGWFIRQRSFDRLIKSKKVVVDNCGGRDVFTEILDGHAREIEQRIAALMD